MKKTIALSTTMFMLLCMGTVFAGQMEYNYTTQDATKWQYADLKGTPALAYEAGTNGANYLNATYAQAFTIAKPNTAWNQSMPWIGPSTDAAVNGSTSAGYTAYRAQGFRTIEKSLSMEFSADNAVSNIFVGNSTLGFIDLLSTDVLSMVYTPEGADDPVSVVEVSYTGAPNYSGPEYSLTPYNGQGLFSGKGFMNIAWQELLTQAGLFNPNGGQSFEEFMKATMFDFYFITQNTNPSSGTSATGFAANFTGIVPEGGTTPEPATLAIFGMGLIGAGMVARKRNRK